MATYSNKHWLLSHIRNSFISTDDTGISELVMNSDDLAKSLAQRCSKSGEMKENFTVYPGLTSDLTDQDDDELLSQSFEINFAQEGSFFRFRTGTDAKLDKMSDMRKKQSQIRTVCITDQSFVKINSMDQDQEELFIRKEFSDFCLQPKTSKLVYQIENLPPTPVNRFRQYSCFDGTSHPLNEIRNINVFIVPFAKEQRSYPIKICIQATAKICEFIGFILFKCTQDLAEASKIVEFEEVKDYGLFITDETGEPDLDFPALDSNEQVQRFQFAYLALAKRIEQPFHTQRAFSVVSETLPPVSLKTPDASSYPSRRNDEIAMVTHDTMVNAPNYRAYRIFFISKKHFRTEIQLGIDGEKIEIDPLQQKASIIFKASVKAIHYSVDSVAWCRISGRKSSRFEFKIAHDPLYVDPLTLGTSTSIHESSTYESSKEENPLKVHTFETDPTTAEEIVLKINNILMLKNSSIFREHPNRSDKTKKSFMKRKMFLV